MKRKLLVIDGDHAPYAYGGRPDFDAIVATDNWLQTIYDQCGTSHAILCLSGAGNFRYDYAVTKGYKENRSGQQRPDNYDLIKDYMFRKTNCLKTKGMEADDLIRCLHTAYSPYYDVIIVSNDKDFNLVTCKQYRHSDNKHMEFGDEIIEHQKSVRDSSTGFVTISKYYGYYGKYALYYQMLIGDTADNIAGIPGIGKSNKIFKEEFIQGISIQEAQAIVWREYLLYYGTEAVDRYLEHYLLLNLIRSNINIL